jgi:hypothetical protein
MESPVGTNDEQGNVESSSLQTTTRSGTSSGNQFTSLDTDTAPASGSSRTSAAYQFIFIGFKTYHSVATLLPKSLVRNYPPKSPNAERSDYPNTGGMFNYLK